MILNWKNELDAVTDDLQVQLRMKSSTDYKVHGDSTVNTCVCGKDSTTSDFLVTLNNIGTVNLTITVSLLVYIIICGT